MWWFAVLVVVLALSMLLVHDLVQRRHAVLRNFPVVGHLRFLLERIGPELRQYVVAGNDEERPFSRDQRRWVYASAKEENAYFGFGTDAEVETSALMLGLNAPSAALTPPPSAPVSLGMPSFRDTTNPKTPPLG